MTTLSRWFVPGVGILLGAAIGAAEWVRSGSAWQAVVAFAIVAGYSLVLRTLQSRSDMASLLSGLPRDERWTWINLRALSLAAQVMALVLVGAFLANLVSGGDADVYARLAAVFAVAYLGGLAWYRSRS